jgi:hypothetical protein|tara:strand:- start:4587 stop:4709 length:123 start_codon:yes stop_codon:yes gene_type:complete
MENKFIIGLMLSVGFVGSLWLASSIIKTASQIKQNKEFEQ